MKISSTQNEMIKALAKLKTKKAREQQQRFLLEDVDLLKEALALNLVETICYVGKFPSLDGVKMQEVSENVLKKLSTLKSPGNFVAVCKMPVSTKEGNYVIALDGLQDPGNGGTILRSALAFGFEEILISSSSFDIYNEKFIRATKGAFFHLPIKRLDLLEELKKRKMAGYELIALMPDEQAKALADLKVSSKMVIIVGSEGQGISKEIASLAKQKIVIPIAKKMESLNAAVAAAISMYEVQQKRGKE
ncbi:MAG: TrmH family RNA methyltransferase [Bacilli bacterium]